MQQAKKDSTPDTFVNSQLALEGMERLMNSPNKLCQACKDGCIHFMTAEGMSDTLAQMLSGMCKRRGGTGSQPGEASGGGAGDANDGFSTEGDSLLNAPVYGPDRLAFSGSSSAQGRQGKGGQSGDGRPGVTPETSSAIGSAPVRATSKRQISLRDVPERYREAVRKFYGEEAVIETTVAPTQP